MKDKLRELERKSRAAFDASVGSQDAATRAGLARARAAALEELRHRRIAGPATWVPAGAAAAALVAVLLWQREEAAVTQAPDASTVAFEDLEIVAGGEDFDMLSEDEDFVSWAVQETSGGVG